MCVHGNISTIKNNQTTYYERQIIPSISCLIYSKDDDVPQLAGKTMDVLNLLPVNVQPTDRGADAIKAVLGILRAIPIKLAEIRNPFESGHGKSASFQGLEVRHAKLAVGSSITFVDFIWNTYESSKTVK